jgi:uncharacterized membrane protein
LLEFTDVTRTFVGGFKYGASVVVVVLVVVVLLVVVVVSGAFVGAELVSTI